MDDSISARAQLSESRQVHHTRVLNLSSGTEAVSGDALGAFSASLVWCLWRSEKPPDIQCVTQRRVVTPEAGWRSLVGGFCVCLFVDCIIMTFEAWTLEYCWNITKAIVLYRSVPFPEMLDG